MGIKKHITLITVLIIASLSGCNGLNETDKYNSTVFYATDQYQTVCVEADLSMSYLDLNPEGAKTILLLHGEPGYSFIYRNIAPDLCNAGYRVVIPDLIGFGHSSKPKERKRITYSNHTQWLNSFIDKLKLKQINLFAHDWGAMISLRIIADQPQLFNKVAISYGYLFDGAEPLPEAFLQFREYAKSDKSFSAGNIMDWGSNIVLADSVKAMYDKPFIEPSDLLAARIFPSLIPEKDDDEALINKLLVAKLKTYDKPFVTIWGNHYDALWVGKDQLLQSMIPGAKDQKHYVLDSNHFIQEDQAQRLVSILLEYFK